MTRAAANGAPVYFCATLPHTEYSSLALDGVAFYVMIHRALSTGAAKQGKARQLAAGTPAAREVAAWTPLSEKPEGALSSDRAVRAGALQNADRLVSLNRPAGEDMARVLNQAAVDRLFGGLEYRQVTDRVGDRSSLASEIWRSFLFAMAVALLVEAWLCLPERKRRQAEAAVA